MTAANPTIPDEWPEAPFVVVTMLDGVVLVSEGVVVVVGALVAGALNGGSGAPAGHLAVADT
ncbi:hypothetical protein AAVH_33838, partial [Aphelenchoides avenae]